MKKLVVALALLLSACIVPGGKPVVTPPTPVPTTRHLSVHLFKGDPALDDKIVGAQVHLNGTAIDGVTGESGDVGLDGAPLTPLMLCASAANFVEGCVDVSADQTDVQVSLVVDMPAPPTRTQVGSVHTSFQGLTVQTKQFGAMPWFGPALAWLDNPEDRQAVYAAEIAAGDTHCVVGLPNGPPLYDEPNQFYTADKFGPKDWTAGNTTIDPRFVSLVREIVQSKLIPIIFLGGDDGERGYLVANKQLPLLVAALGDINKYVLIVPGFDGVFYGWTPEHIGQFGQLFRSLSPNGYLGLEHSTGHIPTGEGDADWVRGGRMTTYDVLLSEFDTDNLHQDSTWQIAARTIGPAYRRPAEQPAVDDPNPPFYLRGGTPRGPYFVVAFEFDTYFWVRGLTPGTVWQHRLYLKNLGYTFLG